nr:hypothetical protein [Tanacetum cinerariifolium]
MLVIKRFSKRNMVFREREKTEEFRAKRNYFLRRTEQDCMMMVKEIVNRLLEEVGESFWEEGDDFRVDIFCFHTCLTDIVGFLEKLECWFEQDIDDEGEEGKEGEGGSEV